MTFTLADSTEVCPIDRSLNEKSIGLCHNNTKTHINLPPLGKRTVVPAGGPFYKLKKMKHYKSLGWTRLSFELLAHNLLSQTYVWYCKNI
jgi:hypothetical protein